jgi:hypothetical protein
MTRTTLTRKTTALMLICLVCLFAGASVLADDAIDPRCEPGAALDGSARVYDVRVERLLDADEALIDGVPTRHFWYRTTYSIHDPVTSVTCDYEIFEDVWSSQDASTLRDDRSDPVLHHSAAINKIIASAQREVKQGVPVVQNGFARATARPEESELAELKCTALARR